MQDLTIHITTAY